MTCRAVAEAPVQPEAAPSPVGAHSLHAAVPVDAGAKGRDVRSGTSSAHPTAAVGASVSPAYPPAGPSGPGVGCG